MTNPTPDQVKIALNVLYRVPGVEEGSTLAEIEAEINPIAPMAHAMRRELLLHFRSHVDVPDFGTLSDMLTHLATESGLRITTDPEPPAPAPGEKIGYVSVEPKPFISGWAVPEMPVLLTQAIAVKNGHDGRLAAVYLLPEGGKA